MNYDERDPPAMVNGGSGISGQPDTRHGPGPRLMGADTLVGNAVYNASAQELGVIKEIMLDMRDGRVSYAVLSFGQTLGLGGKLFAVPWAALALDTENKRFLLNVEKARLESAPGFDRNHWPDMADETWARSIHAFDATARPDAARPAA